MTGACADLDDAGYWSLECWGGATYDSCIRFLNEDPWERLRTFKRLMAKAAQVELSVQEAVAEVRLRGHPALHFLAQDLPARPNL